MFFILTLIIFLLILSPNDSKYVHHSFDKDEKRKEKTNVNELRNNDWVNRLHEAMNIKEINEVDAMESNEKKTSFIRRISHEWSEKIVKPVLNIRPSRNIIYGTFSAGLNVLKGYFVGIQIVLNYPFVGWFQHQSIFQLLENSVVGLLSGVLMAGSGVVAGGYQILSGVKGTVKGIGKKISGMVWSEEEGEWVFYSLSVEERRLTKKLEELHLLSSPGESNIGKKYGPHLRKRSKRRVKDLSFYNFLKVSADASKVEIKHAYYREAMKVHPDKSLDKVSEGRFLKLSSVYQTLVNEEMREAYDSYGVCYETDTSKIDVVSLFALIFGSALVEPYIGQLEIASIVDDLFDLSNIQNERLKYSTCKIRKITQQKRQVSIAIYLKKRVSNYVDEKNSYEEFRTSCKKEAEIVLDGNFGDIFLSSIGSALVSESSQFLGFHQSFLGLAGQSLRLRNKASRLMKIASTKILIGETILISIQAYLDARKGVTEKSEVEMNSSSENVCESNKSSELMNIMIQKLETSLPLVLELGWKMNVQDISNTLHEACEKLFNEQNSPEKKRLTGEAVRILGQEFLDMGKQLKESRQSLLLTDQRKMKEWINNAFVASVVLEDNDSEI